MTHNFLHDLEILKHLLPSNAAYIGVLGPRRRTDELLEKIGSETLLSGISPTSAQLERLFAPIGLDLGAETPEEIALSIVAEIQKVKRQKSGASLRERGSIH
jgi:xanthine/CO dehydrogenase XdhC/CoxF family maturation factor